MSDREIIRPVREKEGTNVTFSPAVLEKIEKIKGRYPAGREKSALLPILHIAQEELGGYLSVDVMDYVASLLHIQPIEVYEVATFYTQYYLDPVGRHVIEVCRTGPCAICGGERISAYLAKKLNINPGETTSDGLFTLKEVECLGACGSAPVMQVNTQFYEFLTEEKIDQILEELRAQGNEDKPEKSKWIEKFF
ncbi:MAG: NADH-quinone oxidoreductase subunit NuoE [Marinilabiliales bacterium]|nr:NADH-quinone oxidoreductase subunit NuoE [Marinilabiliales bacterium]